jgi:hypothetical protein
VPVQARIAVITRCQREHPEQRAEHQRRTWARRVARGVPRIFSMSSPFSKSRSAKSLKLIVVA